MDINQVKKRIEKEYPKYLTKRKAFTMIPNLFIERTDCTIYEKMVYISIKKHQMRNPHSWPSHKTIAREARCSVSTVKKAIKVLVEKGWIEKTRSKEHRSCIYTPKLGSSP